LSNASARRPAKGYRTLAVARGPEQGAPVLLGLVSLYDPPRPDARQLIATLIGLGVSVKMLTGDALAVALEIGEGVGLPDIRRVSDLKAAGARPATKRLPCWRARMALPRSIPRTSTLSCNICRPRGMSPA
jgi:magnesium-transporting ATPase (P-type)